jgi:pimeloyl-ACP methyl ester carboxylesterase
MPHTGGKIELRERSFVAGDRRINYAQGPRNGPALVLVHGGSARWQHWLPLATDLASTTHVFAPDLRGHGRSSWMPHQYRLIDFAADLEAFLEGVVRASQVSTLDFFHPSLSGQTALARVTWAASWWSSS